MNFRRLGLGALLSLTFGYSGAAQAAPPAEVFFKQGDFPEATLSPSGKQLAILSPRGVPLLSLAVIDLENGMKIHRTAQFSDGEVRAVRWVNEDRLIFSVLDRSEGSGIVRAASGLFAVDPDGSNFITLIRRRWKEGVTAGPLNIKILDWHHRLLRVPAFSVEKNDEVLVTEYSYLAEKDADRPLWVNTRTGRTKRVNFEIPDGISGWEVDDLGDVRGAMRFQNGRLNLLWRAPGSSEWTTLYTAPQLNVPFSPTDLTSDGTWYVTDVSGPGGTTTLKRFDFAKMKPEATPLVAVDGFDFSGGLVRNPEGGAALGVRLLADAETTVWFDPRIKAFQAEVDKLFPATLNRIDCRRCGQPDMVALVRASSDRDPGRLYLYQGKPKSGEKPWRLIGAVNEDIDPAQMAGVDFQRIPTRDGKSMPVWVTSTPGSKAPKPAVVLVHGGPWSRGASWSWDAEAQFLASRGYVVIEPEIRGSTGYGDDWFRAGFKQWGQAMQDDVTDALRWAQRRGLASDRACIMGASYGGYSTLMGLIKDPGLYKCGVAAFAVADLELHVKGDFWVDDDISKYARQFGYRELIGDPDKDADMLAANSPVRQAQKIKAPLLLAFGERDRRVPLEHGERMRQALIAAGQTPEWVVYKGEGHGFGIPANRIDFYKRVEAFLAKHLDPAQR